MPNLNLRQRDSTEANSRLRLLKPNPGPRIKALRSKIVPLVSRIKSNLETIPEPSTQPREILLTSKAMLKKLPIGVNKPLQMFKLTMPQQKKNQQKKNQLNEIIKLLTIV